MNSIHVNTVKFQHNTTEHVTVSCIIMIKVVKCKIYMHVGNKDKLILTTLKKNIPRLYIDTDYL